MTHTYKDKSTPDHIRHAYNVGRKGKYSVVEPKEYFTKHASPEEKEAHKAGARARLKANLPWVGGGSAALLGLTVGGMMYADKQKDTTPPASDEPSHPTEQVDTTHHRTVDSAQVASPSTTVDFIAEQQKLDSTTKHADKGMR